MKVSLIRPVQGYLSPTRSRRAAEVLLRKDVCGATLLLFCLDRFGLDCVGGSRNNPEDAWDPYTFELEIRAVSGAELPESHLDRLMAAVSIFTTDDFFTSVKRFIPLANVLAGDSFDPAVFDPADPWECAWAVTQALLLSPPDEGRSVEDTFSMEIRKYLGLVLREYGFVQVPRWLSFAVLPPNPGLMEAPSDMFADGMAIDTERLTSVDDTVKAGLLALVDQLRSLPLENGNTDKFAEHLSRAAETIAVASGQ